MNLSFLKSYLSNKHSEYPYAFPYVTGIAMIIYLNYSLHSLDTLSVIILILLMIIASFSIVAILMAKGENEIKRKSREEDLIISEEKFRVVAESIPSAILIFQNSKIIYTNKKANEITSLTDDELFRDINSLAIVHKRDLAKVVGIIKDFNERKITETELEFKIIVKDKQEKWIHCVAISNYLSGVPSVVVTINDITDKRNVELGLERYIEELHVSRSLIEQNAEELLELNGLLAESEKKLKKLNSDKDKFFSIISHDLRSPFNSLLGFTEILSNDIDELTKEDIKAFSSNINSSAKNLLDHLNSLLEWSRLNNGDIKNHPEKLNLKKVVDDTVMLLYINAIKKNIHIDIDIAENVFIYADTKIVRSILQNLLSNAIKFTFKNGTISVNATTDADNIIISVKDSGVGIGYRDVEKLFRIDTNHSTKGTDNEVGSGLGLILCKNLIEINNGKIWVESKIGDGSTFHFTLPEYTEVKLHTENNLLIEYTHSA